MKLPYQIRKKMAIGGPFQKNLNRIDRMLHLDASTVSTPRPALSSDTSKAFQFMGNPKIGTYSGVDDYTVEAPLDAAPIQNNMGLPNQSTLPNQKEDWENDYAANKNNYQAKFDKSLLGVQNNQADRDKYNQFYNNKYPNPYKSSMTYGDLMYGANVGLMAVSQGRANRQTQASIDAQIGNPLFNEVFNDGRSLGVQYGYETFQQGGQTQNNNNMNEHSILTAYLQQVPPNQRRAIMKQLAQLKQTNPDKYQQTLSQLGQSMQEQGQEEQMSQARYGRYMQEGGVMDQQQDAAQQQQPQQEGDQQGQMIQQVAQMLQQGASPQQVVQQLVQMGMPQDQATQLVQQVMQQMQGQQQPQQAPQMKMGGKYRKMY